MLVLPPDTFQRPAATDYQASLQLPGPALHRQATTSFRPNHGRWTNHLLIIARTGVGLELPPGLQPFPDCLPAPVEV